MACHPISLNSKAKGLLRQCSVGHTVGLSRGRYLFMEAVWVNIDSLSHGLCDDGHQLSAHSSSAAFRSDVFKRNCCSASKAIGTAAAYGAIRWGPIARFDLVGNGAGGVIYRWFDPGLLACLVRQRKGTNQRHPRTTCRIWTDNSPCPEPRDDRRVLAFRQLYLGIKMANSLECPVAHPLAVVADVIRQAASAGPHALPAHLLLRSRINRRLAGELGRDLDESLRDENSHRVQVTAVRFEPQPLRFQRNRPATTEGIVDRWRITAGRFQDLRVRLVQH